MNYKGTSNKQVRLPIRPFAVAIERINGQEYLTGVVILGNLFAFVTYVMDREEKFIIDADTLDNVRIPAGWIPPTVNGQFGKKYTGWKIRYALRADIV